MDHATPAPFEPEHKIDALALATGAIFAALFDELRRQDPNTPGRVAAEAHRYVTGLAAQLANQEGHSYAAAAEGWATAFLAGVLAPPQPGGV